MTEWQGAKPDESMALPIKNDFIAEDLSLKADKDQDVSKFPCKIVEDGLGELYHRPDNAFQKPLAYVNFLVVTPMAFSSLKEAICLDVMVWL